MHTLIQLPYEVNALAPYINEQTVLIHHGKHHAAYVNRLNELLTDLPELAALDLEELLERINEVPESKRQAVINNAGRVYNHNIYWLSMKPNGGGEPVGVLAEKIDEQFESFENFKKLWKEAGTTQFGSGWVWLSLDESGNLSIDKTGNADNPIFHGKKAILTMDVWEHAYYLDYQNRRPDYIDQFFALIDWEGAEETYEGLLD